MLVGKVGEGERGYLSPLTGSIRGPISPHLSRLFLPVLVTTLTDDPCPALIMFTRFSRGYAVTSLQNTKWDTPETECPERCGVVCGAEDEWKGNRERKSTAKTAWQSGWRGRENFRVKTVLPSTVGYDVCACVR